MFGVRGVSPIGVPLSTFTPPVLFNPDLDGTRLFNLPGSDGPFENTRLNVVPGPIMGVGNNLIGAHPARVIAHDNVGPFPVKVGSPVVSMGGPYPVPVPLLGPILRINKSNVSNFKNLREAKTKYETLEKELGKPKTVNNVEGGYILWEDKENKNIRIMLKDIDVGEYYIYMLIKTKDSGDEYARIVMNERKQGDVKSNMYLLGNVVDYISFDIPQQMLKIRGKTIEAVYKQAYKFATDRTDDPTADLSEVKTFVRTQVAL